MLNNLFSAFPVFQEILVVDDQEKDIPVHRKIVFPGNELML